MMPSFTVVLSSIVFCFCMESVEQSVCILRFLMFKNNSEILKRKWWGRVFNVKIKVLMPLITEWWLVQLVYRIHL